MEMTVDWRSRREDWEREFKKLRLQLRGAVADHREQRETGWDNLTEDTELVLQEAASYPPIGALNASEPQAHTSTSM